MTKENPWSALDHAEHSTHHLKATSEATTANPSSPYHTTSMPGGNTHDAQGIAQALSRRSTVNEAKAILKAIYIWPDERVRPLSWQPPASWGQPRTVWRITVHGKPVDSMFFENGEHVRRAAFKTQGYDTD